MPALLQQDYGSSLTPNNHSQQGARKSRANYGDIVSAPHLTHHTSIVGWAILPAVGLSGGSSNLSSNQRIASMAIDGTRNQLPQVHLAQSLVTLCVALSASRKLFQIPQI